MNRNRDIDAAPGWRDLLWGANLIRSLTLCGGVALHAVNLYIATTILPSVVRDIGGIDYYAWNTSAFVVASILGAAVSARLLTRAGPRAAYSTAAVGFAVGAYVCAVAPSMPIMLIGRFVQGLGGGVLLALPYAMVRTVFPEPLWPRAMALLSGMWGIATLLGPAIGGAFAESGLWRAAFWSLIPFAALFALTAVMVLPAAAERGRSSPLPTTQLLLLSCAVLAASAGSIGDGILWNAAGIALAIALLLALARTEALASHRLLPRRGFNPTSPLGALYAMSALLAVTVTCTEIFVPLFLQVLHRQSPLQAGYIAALMSAGWTLGAIVSSGLPEPRLSRAVRAAPLLSSIALTTLAVVLPRATDPAWVSLAPISLALIVGGTGVGLAYPHLAAWVLRVAPADEQDLAASSIMTVQLCATAFGAALAGLTVNTAGLSAGGEMDLANAARWLFAVFLVAPLLCLRMIRTRSEQVATAH